MILRKPDLKIETRKKNLNRRLEAVHSWETDFTKLVQPYYQAGESTAVTNPGIENISIQNCCNILPKVFSSTKYYETYKETGKRYIETGKKTVEIVFEDQILNLLKKDIKTTTINKFSEHKGTMFRKLKEDMITMTVSIIKDSEHT